MKTFFLAWISRRWVQKYPAYHGLYMAERVITFLSTSSNRCQEYIPIWGQRHVEERRAARGIVKFVVREYELLCRREEMEMERGYGKEQRIIFVRLLHIVCHIN